MATRFREPFPVSPGFRAVYVDPTSLATEEKAVVAFAERLFDGNASGLWVPLVLNYDRMALMLAGDDERFVGILAPGERLADAPEVRVSVEWLRKRYKEQPALAREAQRRTQKAKGA